jgi:hypothetical protein
MLFERPEGVSFYDVLPDGTRFVALRQPAIPPVREIVVVERWLDDVRRTVPVP